MTHAEQNTTKQLVTCNVLASTTAGCHVRGPDPHAGMVTPSSGNHAESCGSFRFCGCAPRLHQTPPLVCLSFCSLAKTVCSINDFSGPLGGRPAAITQKSFGKALAVITQRLPKLPSDLTLRSNQLVSMEVHLGRGTSRVPANFVLGSPWTPL